MDRRRFLLTSLAGALAAPLAGEAQQADKIARIGYLSLDLATSANLREAFLQGLRDLGYVEGRNVAIEYRDAEGKPERLPLLRPNWLRSRLMSSSPLAHPMPWPLSKRPEPSPLSSLLPMRLQVASSPVLRGLAAMSRGCPCSPRRSLSASVWNCSSRPFPGLGGSLSSGNQVSRMNARKRPPSRELKSRPGR
jgi:hypothetical protein